MTKAARINDILNSWWHGLRTTSEAIRALDALSVRGAFGDRIFTGYDYEAQCWVTFPPHRAIVT